MLPKHLIRKVGSLSKIYDAYKWLLNSSRIQHFKTEEIYEQTKFFIPFQNGIYDAKNDRLLSYRRIYLSFIRLTQRIRTMPCILLRRSGTSFLDSSFHDDKENAIRLHEMIGYILMPTNDAKYFLFSELRQTAEKVSLQISLSKFWGGILSAM